MSYPPPPPNPNREVPATAKSSSSFIQSFPPSVSFPSCVISQSYSSTIILSSMLTTANQVTIAGPTNSRRQYEVSPSSTTIPAYKRANPALPPSVSSPQGVPVTVKLRISSLTSTDIRSGQVGPVFVFVLLSCCFCSFEPPPSLFP